MENYEKKKGVNYTIDKDVLEQFKLTAAALNRSQSEIIEEFIRNFIISNKAEVNSAINKWWLTTNGDVYKNNNNDDEKKSI